MEGNIEGYIANNLGFKIENKGDMRTAIVSFPKLISSFFDGRLLTIEGVEHILIASHAKGTDFPMSVLIKRVKLAEEKLRKPCILALDALDASERRLLIANKVSFVVADRQIYLPTMGSYFTENRLNSYKNSEQLSPASQFLILYHLQKRKLSGLSYKDIAECLNYPPKTITLAVTELKQAGICEIVPLGGRNKGLEFKMEGRDLWNSTLPLLSSPIMKVGYIAHDAFDTNEQILTYDDALSHYTDMGHMPQHCYAIERRTAFGKDLSERVSSHNLPDSYRIEFWKYNPAKLAIDGYIDPLSLILIYKDNEDERIQGQIERLLERVL